MGKWKTFLLCLTVLLCGGLYGCASTSEAIENTLSSRPEPTETIQEDSESEETKTENEGFSKTQSQNRIGEDMLVIQIGDTQLKAKLEDNKSAEALKELLADGPMTIDVQNYGGFEKVDMLVIQIGDTQLKAKLEDNKSAEALKELLADGPMTIDVQNYGGFEKVGQLPKHLPSADTQMTTSAGDIVLYQGNRIVFFYGSNSWMYTKLGVICESSMEELREILGSEIATMTLSME